MLDTAEIDPETYVRENRDQIVELLHHSSDSFARACAWALLDRYLEDPEFEEIEQELQQLKATREARS